MPLANGWSHHTGERQKIDVGVATPNAGGVHCETGLYLSG
jgi:hypothetical protein